VDKQRRVRYRIEVKSGKAMIDMAATTRKAIGTRLTKATLCIGKVGDKARSEIVLIGEDQLRMSLCQQGSAKGNVTSRQSCGLV
jgi:hypothetical protein